MIDTQGAVSPASAQEERGQSEAIARNLLVMSRTARADRSGSSSAKAGAAGRFALGVLRPDLHAGEFHLLRRSPRRVRSDSLGGSVEGGRRRRTALRLTAAGSLRIGRRRWRHSRSRPAEAHRDMDKAAEEMGRVLESSLQELSQIQPKSSSKARLEKYSRMGRYLEGGTVRGLLNS
jgi:acetyl-CoA carboxylase carboxyl transferase subunit alpha